MPKPRLSTQGYYFIKKPEHHRANSQGYTKVADLVLEEKLGRLLEKNEIAHHINHVRTDDSPENLQVMTKKEHDSHTMYERWAEYRKLNKWSMRFNYCVNCQTTQRKHARRGLCTQCSHYLERKKMSEKELAKLIATYYEQIQ